MTDSSRPNRFQTQLLRQDQTLNDTQYKEYRMQLEQTLSRVERREKIAMWVAYIAIPLSVVLSFVGGSGVIGAFDPYDPRANPFSMTVAGIFILSVIAGPMGIASYYTRFRPKIKEIKDQIRDANILAIHSEVAELRKQVEILIGKREV